MKKLSEYPALIVDLDGTLYAQRPVRLAMLREILRQFHRLSDFRIIRKYRRMYEQGLSETARLARLPARAPGVIREWMIERPLPYLRRYRDDALMDLLARARERGIKVFICSDYPAAEKLAALSLAVDGVCSAADTGCLKPDPSALLDMLGPLGIRASDCLVIGDRADKDGAMAAAMRADFLLLPADMAARRALYARL